MFMFMPIPELVGGGGGGAILNEVILGGAMLNPEYGLPCDCGCDCG
jgi:hypothetical protein